MVEIFSYKWLFLGFVIHFLVSKCASTPVSTPSSQGKPSTPLALDIFQDLSTFEKPGRNSLPPFISKDAYLTSHILSEMANQSTIKNTRTKSAPIHTNYNDTLNNIAPVNSSKSSNPCPMIIAFQIKEVLNFAGVPGQPDKMTYNKTIQMVETPLKSGVEMGKPEQNVAYVKKILKYVGADAGTIFTMFNSNDNDDIQYDFDNPEDMDPWTAEICDEISCAKTLTGKALMANSTVYSGSSDQWYSFSGFEPIQNIVNNNIGIIPDDERHVMISDTTISTTLVCGKNVFESSSKDMLKKKLAAEQYGHDDGSFTLDLTESTSLSQSILANPFTCSATSVSMGELGHKQVSPQSNTFQTEVTNDAFVSTLNLQFGLNFNTDTFLNKRQMLATTTIRTRQHDAQVIMNRNANITSWSKTNSMTLSFPVLTYAAGATSLQANLAVRKQAVRDYLVVGVVDECMQA